MRILSKLLSRLKFITITTVAIIAIFLIYPVSIGSGFYAQESIIFDNVFINIWPEYDQPSVLVMYNITLSSEVKLPATIAISIPARAGDPHAVATKDVNGLYNLQYQTALAGERRKITFTTSMPEFRIEYYDPSLNRQGFQRSFLYQWVGEYQVNNLIIQVQQPLKATNLVLSPDMGSGVNGEDGLTYFSLLAGQYDKGKPFELQITYQKADDSLSTTDSFQQVQPSVKVDDQTAGRVTLNELIPWLLGGLGIILIGSGSWWYWQSGRQKEPAPNRNRHKRRIGEDPRITTQPGGTEKKQEGAYCHQCGRRAAAGDIFCRACGTKLR